MISRLLNEQKVQTRVNISYDKNKVIKFKKIPKLSSDIRWSDKQVYDILRNPIYKGQRRYKGELLSIQPIISEELFDECKNLRENKRTRNMTTSYTYLLKDLIICGVCGRNYYARYKPIKRGDKVYKCSSTLTHQKSCGNCGINIELIESVLFDDMVQSKSLLKYLDDRKEIKKNIEIDITKIKNQISIDESSLKDKNEENNRLLEIYLHGSITIEKFEKNQERIQNESKLLSNRLKLLKKELIRKVKIKDELNNITPTTQMLINSKNDRTKLRLIFNQIIHKIIVNKIDHDTALICVFLKFEGEVFMSSGKFLLDLGGVRKKPIVFQYIGVSNLENEPVFDKDNKLMTDINEIKKEILSNKNIILDRMFKSGFRDNPENSSQWLQVKDVCLLRVS